MKLSLITNNIELAQRADDCGIDRIMIDLERLEKGARQMGRGLFLSDHKPEDISSIRQVLRKAAVMVRVDPLHAGSPAQIDLVIQSGAGFVMLPFFHARDEAARFIDLVGGRAEPVLLFETGEAVVNLQSICRLPGLAEIHIGLNDLSMSLGQRCLFDPIADGTIDRLCGILRDEGIPFGFGGIGSLTRRDLPVDPESVLAEQICQGATRGWMGRTFRDAAVASLPGEIALVRAAIERWRSANLEDRQNMRERLHGQIAFFSEGLEHFK